MKYRVFSMSRLTAAIITITLVVCLAFSMMTYLGDNLQGGEDLITGGGSSSSNVAGATVAPNMEWENATKVTSDMLTDMGSVGADNYVTYASNRKRGTKTAGTIKDTNGWARYPSKYFQLPSYGSYDLTDCLVDSVAGPANRLFGMEFNSAFTVSVNPETGVWGSDSAMNSDGIGTNNVDIANKLGLPGSATNKRGKGMFIKDDGSNGLRQMVVYATIALPDSAITMNENVKFEIDFNSQIYAGGGGRKAREVKLGYSIIADKGEVGLCAPLFSTDNPKANSIGIDHALAASWGGDNPLWNRIDTSTQEALVTGARNIDGFSANYGGAGYSWRVSNKVTVPTGTRYLRIVIAASGDHGADSFEKSFQTLISNMKIRVYDDTTTNTGTDKVDHWNLTADGNNEDKTYTNSYNETYTVLAGNDNPADSKNPVTDWKNIRYVDIHMNSANGVMTKKNAFDPTSGLQLRYINPKTGNQEYVALGELKVLGKNFDPSVMSDYIYIVDDNLAYASDGHADTTNVKFANEDGTESYNKGGIHIRLALRTGMLYINRQVVYYHSSDSVAKESTFSVLDSQADISDTTLIDDRMTQYMVDTVAPSALGFNVKFDKTVSRSTVAFNYNYTNSKVIEVESKPHQQSPAKAYYYNFGQGDVNMATLADPNNGTEIVDFGIQTHLAPASMELTTLSHGKHNVVIFMRDACNNVTLVPITGAKETGEIVLAGDASVINNETVKANVYVDDVLYSDVEAVWYTGDNMKIVLEALPVNEHEDFIGGLMYYIMAYDKDGTNGKLVTAVDMNAKAGVGQEITIPIDKNVYKSIKIIVVNKADHSDVTTLPKNEEKFVAATFNNNKDNFLLRRDNTKPKFNISNYTSDSQKSWQKDAKKFTLTFNTKGSVMFDSDNEPIVEYRVKTSSNPDVYSWKRYDQSKIVLANDTAGQTLTFQMGKDRNDNVADGVLPITLDGTSTIGSYNDAKYLSSYEGNFGFRVKYPNRDGFYLFNSTAPELPPYSVEDHDNGVQGAPSTEDGDGAHRINIRLDNVTPEVTVVGHYIEADLSELHDSKDDAAWNKAIKDIADTDVGVTLTIDGVGEYEVKAIPDGNLGNWFWGTVGIKVHIANYGNILSKNDMRGNTQDLYRKDTADANGDIIYEQAGATVYINGKGSIISYDPLDAGQVAAAKKKAVKTTNYVSFSNKAEAIGTNNKVDVEKVIRPLGFKIETGSHIIVKAVPAGYDPDNNKLLMQYDNIVPEFSFKVNTEEITGDVDKWHSSDVTLEIQLLATDCYKKDGYPTYKLTRDEDEVPSPFTNKLKTYAPAAFSDETDEDGIIFVMESENIAGRKKTITYAIKIDKTVDDVVITSWANDNIYNKDKVKYVAAKTIAGTDAFGAKVTPALSPVEYSLVLSDRTGSNDAFADEILLDKFKKKDAALSIYEAKFDGEFGTFSVAGPINSLGNKFAYIVSKDMAGHYAVHSLAGNFDNELRLTIDDQPYNFTFTAEYNNAATAKVGDVAKVDVISRNTGKTVSGANLSELHVGDVVLLKATPANAGIKFLGWTGAEDTNADVNGVFDVDYIDSPKAYTIDKALFKTIINLKQVDNNIQKISGSIFAFAPFKGVLDEGETKDKKFIMDTTVDPYTEVDYLEVKWDAGEPNAKGQFGYTIVIASGKKADYWMQQAYAGVLIVTDRDVINIIFDSANAAKEYIYNNEVFINSNKKGSFLDAKNFYAVNIANTDMSQAVIDNIKNGALKYTVEKMGDADYAPFAGDVKDVGSYRFSIKQTGPTPQPATDEMQFGDYDINFAVEFTVVPRAITVTNSEDIITKEYDGTNNVVLPSIKTAVDYIVADTVRTNVGDKTLAEIMDDLTITLGNILDTGTFLYDGTNTATKRATLSGVKIKDGVTNFVLDGGVSTVDLKYNATIEKKGITINATNRLYSKPYDATRVIINNKGALGENYSEFVSIGGENPGMDQNTPLYWFTTDLCGGDDIKFVFDVNAVYLDTPHVGKSNFIRVDLGKVSLANVDGGLVNYEITSIGKVENVEITRAEVSIKIDDSVSATKEFDGKRFTIGLIFNNLIGNDATMGEYGIPLLFEEQGNVKYTNNTKGGDYIVGQVEDYPWNIGQYTVILGEPSGPNPEDPVYIGSNYVLNKNDKYIYSFEIVPKELVVVVEDVDVSSMTNVKYYDGKTIGGKQIYNKSTDKNTVSFKVTGKNDTINALDLVENYTVEFTIVSDGRAVGDGYVLTVTSEIDVLNGGAITDNYFVSDIRGAMKYNIIRRPIYIAPTESLRTVTYDASETRRIVTLDHYSDVDFWDIVNGKASPLDELEDELIIKELMESKFDIRLVIKDEGNNDAKNANIEKKEDEKNPTAAYHFDIFGKAKIENNGVQNFIINVNEDPDDIISAYIMQAKYFISVNDVKKEAAFDDAITAINELPQFDTLGTDYNIFTEDMVSVNDESLKKEIIDHPISYYKVNTKNDEAGFAGYDHDGQPHKLINATGDLLTSIDNYGVGTYELRFSGKIKSDEFNNYTIVNIGTNNEIKPIKEVNFKYVVDETTPSFLVKVTPIDIRVTRNRIKGDYGSTISMDGQKIPTTIGSMLNNYRVDTEAKDPAVLAMFKPQYEAGSMMFWREKVGNDYLLKDTVKIGSADVEIASLTPDQLTNSLFAGNYYVSLQYFMQGSVYVMRNPRQDGSDIVDGKPEDAKDKDINNNYILTVYDKQYIEIDPVRVYVRFAAADMVQNYNNATPAILPQTEFYNEFNAKINVPGKVYFKVVDGNMQLAKNASQAGGYAIVIDKDASHVDSNIPTGNYYLDKDYPILVPNETYTNVFTIRPRPVYINMTRTDTTCPDPLKATYGTTFPTMKGAFGVEIQDANMDVKNGSGLIAGTVTETDTNNMFCIPDCAKPNAAFGYKFEYMGPLNDGRGSLFDIYFTGVDFGKITGNENYDFMNNLTQFKGFQLTKKTIYAQIYNNKKYTPTGKETYGDEKVYVGKDDFSLKFSFAEGMVPDIGASISDYITTLPTIDVIDKVPDNATADTPISFTISMNKASMAWKDAPALDGDTGASTDDIKFDKAYYLADAAHIEFTLKRKPLDINLVVDENFAKEKDAPGVGGIADGSFYVYGKEGTALVSDKKVYFNPNNDKIAEPAQGGLYQIDPKTLEKLVVVKVVEDSEGNKKNITDKLTIVGTGFDIQHAPYVITAEGAEDKKTDFLTFTISFSIELENGKYYNLTVDKSNNNMNMTVDPKTKAVTFTKTIYVKKATAKISVTKAVAGDLTYSKNFFDNFSGSIEGADVDGLSNITIAPENMKFYDSDDKALRAKENKTAFADDLLLQTDATDPTKASAGIIIDETKLDKSTIRTLKEYYIVNVVPSAKITFSKATINFGRTNDTFGITYAVDNVADSKTGKKPTTTAIFRKNMDSVMDARDYKYALKEKRRIQDPVDPNKIIIEYQAPQDDIAPLAYTRNVGDTDYLINTLNAGTYTKGMGIKGETHTGDIFVPNPDFFLDNNPLFNYVMNFDLVVDPCDVNVELYYPNEFVLDASGNPQYNGKEPVTRTIDYTYDYGTTVEEMKTDIRKYSVKITAVQNSDIVIPNGIDGDKDGLIDDITDDANRIIDINFRPEFADNKGMNLFNVGKYTENVTFSLNALNDASQNFIIADGSKAQDAKIEVKPKTLYVKANNNASNILFTSVFGEITERGDVNDAVLKGEAKLFEAKKGALGVVWFEKDKDGKYDIKTQNKNLTYSTINSSLQYYTIDTGHYFTAGKYNVGIRCTDPNYNVYMMRELDVDNKAKLDVNKKEIIETFLYEITPLTITLNDVETIDKHLDKYGVAGVPNERTYGELNYGGIKNIFNSRDVIKNAIYPNVLDWDYVPEIVRGEIFSRIKFKLTYNDGRDFNDAIDKQNGVPTITDTTMLNADLVKPYNATSYTYKATYYTSYGKGDIPSIILSNDVSAPSVFDFTIRKMDISKNIDVRAMVDGKMQTTLAASAPYNGAWHDDAFEIVFKNGVLDMGYITYTIAYKAPGAADFGTAQTYIPKGANGYRPKPSIDAQAGLMLGAGEYQISFAINTVENKLTGKKDASQNFITGATPHTFTYTVEQLSLADIVSNGGKAKKVTSAFDNNFRDDNIAITFNTGLLSFATSGKEMANNKVKYFIKEDAVGSDWMDKDDPMFLHELAADKKTRIRKEGIIKNVGTYFVKVVFTDAAKGNTAFINNYVADSAYEFTYEITPKDVSLVINDSEYTKYYKDGAEVKLADSGIQESYLSDTKNINSEVVYNFDREYTNTKTGTTYAHIGEAPVGTYIVKFTMRPDANYTAISNEKQIEILPKNISRYLDFNEKVVTEDKKDVTKLETQGVLINGLISDKGNYKAEYKRGGVEASINDIADIFVNKISGISYAENIKKPIIKAYIGKKCVATNADGTALFKLPSVGQYTIKVTYETDDNVIIDKTRDFNVRIYQINLEDNPALKDEIFITGGSRDNDNPTVFDFTGVTPDIRVDLEGENLPFDPTRDITIVDLATNEVVEAPSKIGSYMVTIKFPESVTHENEAGEKVTVNGNFNGDKTFYFDIVPIDVSFEFGENAASIVYGTEYDLAYNTDEQFLTITYYSVNGEDKKPLEAKPVNAGSYIAEVSFVHPVAEGDLPNVNIKGDELKHSFAYTIEKAIFDVDSIIKSVYSGTKAYDGKAVTITPEAKYFNGLPEGAKLSLADKRQKILNVNESGYNIDVMVDSTNYEPFKLHYGKYTITKGHLSIELEKKDKDAITIMEPSLSVSVMNNVMYRINGGDWKAYVDFPAGIRFDNLKPNKTYKIDMKVDGPQAQYFEQSEISTEISTMKVDVPGMEEIAVVGVGVVAVVAVGILFGIIRHIRKKRKV